MNNIQLRDLTLVIPAKEDFECLKKFFLKIRLLDVNKILVLSKDYNQSLKFKSNKLKIFKQSKVGFGNALIEGIQKVKTKYFCIFNADGSFNHHDIKKMLRMCKLGNDFVFASRYMKNAYSKDDTVVTFIGNKIFTILGNFFYKLNLTDLLYTFILGDKKKFNSLNIISNGFEFCVELPIKIKKNNFSYVSIPSIEEKRIYGKKNVNELLDGFKILFKMLTLYFMIR